MKQVCSLAFLACCLVANFAAAEETAAARGTHSTAIGFSNDSAPCPTVQSNPSRAATLRGVSWPPLPAKRVIRGISRNTLSTTIPLPAGAPRPRHQAMVDARSGPRNEARRHRDRLGIFRPSLSICRRGERQRQKMAGIGLRRKSPRTEAGETLRRPRTIFASGPPASPIRNGPAFTKSGSSTRPAKPSKTAVSKRLKAKRPAPSITTIRRGEGWMFRTIGASKGLFATISPATLANFRGRASVGIASISPCQPPIRASVSSSISTARWPMPKSG